MKKTFSILISLVLAFMVNAQEIMKIQNLDGTVHEFPVSNIEKIYFESVMTNPCNPEGTEGKPVDLGLSCLWASWNIGSTKAEEPGGLYGWGDPTGVKCSINLDEYPSKTPPTEISGTSYDIATTRWGGDWRLPTYTEIKELYEKCNVTYYYADDEMIFKFTGPNGNYILIPLTGSRYGQELYEGSAYYMSGSLFTEDTSYAWGLDIDDEEMTYGITAFNRAWGIAVRPVCDKKVEISITTGSASNVTENFVTLNGSVAGLAASTTVGFVYDTSRTLSESSGTMIKTIQSNGNYSLNVENLISNTTYYYRAFVYKDGEYIWGDTKSFKTSPKTTYAVGDFYPNDIDPIGVVFSISNGGKNGKIVSLTQSYGEWDSRFIGGSGSYPLGNYNTSDGSLASLPPSSYSDITKFLNELGSGWYCPAIEELKALCGTVSTINTTLRSKGYTPLGQFYYSCNEYVSTDGTGVHAYVVTVTESQFMGYSNYTQFHVSKSNSEGIRGIKKF